MVEFLFLNYPPLTNEILNEAFGTFRTRTVKSRVVKGGVYLTHEVIIVRDDNDDDIMVKQITFSEELDEEGKNIAIVHDYKKNPCEEQIDSPKNRFQIVSNYSDEWEQCRFIDMLPKSDDPKVLRGGLVQCAKCYEDSVKAIDDLFK